MRRYGDSYANSIDSTLSAAANSVDTTSYSRSIQNTRVGANRRTVRSDCLCAANSAYNRMNLIRNKLEHLRPVLSTFYSEVEETGAAIYNIANPMSSVLSNINSSLTSLYGILSETGSYSGTTATPAAISTACSPVREASATMVNYYETTFTNADGTLNQDAVNTYFEEYDELAADGTIDEPQNAYRTYGLIQATEDYLAANDYSDEAYSEATTVLMTGMLEQNHEVPPPCDDNLYYSLEPESRLSYVTYEVRDSGHYFASTYENVAQYNYVAGGYGSDVNHIDDDHPQFVNSLQMSNIMNSMTSNDYIAVPVEMDEEYIMENAIDPEEYEFNPNVNASVIVDVPSRVEFQITTVDPEVITEATGSTYTPDSVVSITYGGETSQGTEGDFYVFDATESYDIYQPTNATHVNSRYVVTGDNSTGALCDSASYEISESYMNSHITDISAWDYINVFVPFVDIGSSALEMPGSVGYVSGVADGMADLADAQAENRDIEYLNDQLDSNEAIGNLYDNTGAYGSYYIDEVVEDDGSRNIDVGSIHTTSPMIDPWEAQTRLGYQQETSDSDTCLVYDLSDHNVVDTLCEESGNASSYYQWRTSMEQYYADTHDGHSVRELTPRQYVEYMEYYNNNIY